MTVTVDDELSVPGLHFTLEAAVDRVVLEHVNLIISVSTTTCIIQVGKHTM
jgi:hypothetical protein